MWRVSRGAVEGPVGPDDLAVVGGAVAATQVELKSWKARAVSGSAALAVKQGARVTVTNQDSTAHTATADDGHSFDTGTLAQGASQTISVSKPGRYPYHCSIHSFMHGTLVVK